MKKICLALTFVFLVAGVASAQSSFYNKEFKVGFRYPASMRLSTKADDLVVLDQSLKGLAMATLRNPGPGIYDADATISAGAMTRDACTALSANDEPQKKRFGAITYDKTEMTEGGMESVHPMEFYRTYHE